jgi:hypothetical protein
VAGDAGADGDVGTAIDEELGHFGVHAFEVRLGVEYRRLATDAAGVDVGAGVNVGSAVEEEASGFKEAVLGRDVEKGRATEGEEATAGMAAI